MLLKPSVFFLSIVTGFALLAGCQPQAPAPSPSISASEPAKSVPNSTNPTETLQAETPAVKESPQAETPEPKRSERAKAVREVEKCEFSMAKVNDPNPPLNVRAAPNATSGEIVGELKNGEYVTIAEEKDGWFRIKDPIEGWIAASRTDSTCNVKDERVQFGQGENSATIDGRFVGGGTHTYRFNLAKGQRVTVMSDRGPLPILVAPNGKELYMMNEQRSWAGNLPTSGDYTLRLDSNFKGYDYKFTIAAE